MYEKLIPEIFTPQFGQYRGIRNWLKIQGWSLNEKLEEKNNPRILSCSFNGTVELILMSMMTNNHFARTCMYLCLVGPWFTNSWLQFIPSVLVIFWLETLKIFWLILMFLTEIVLQAHHLPNLLVFRCLKVTCCNNSIELGFTSTVICNNKNFTWLCMIRSKGDLHCW